MKDTRSFLSATSAGAAAASPGSGAPVVALRPGQSASLSHSVAVVSEHVPATVSAEALLPALALEGVLALLFLGLGP